MKFTEALHVLKNELLKEYGPNAEIIKIGVSYELYDCIMKDVFSGGNYSHIRVGFVEANEPKILGVSIVPRKKDDF